MEFLPALNQLPLSPVQNGDQFFGSDIEDLHIVRDCVISFIKEVGYCILGNSVYFG